MFSDAFGALVIFFLLGIYYRNQKHTRITKSDKEQSEFRAFKKLLALLLLAGYLVIICNDVMELIREGKYRPSFDVFYTCLIFTDVLILLYSLRYSTRYLNLFRFSSFAFATILIKISLNSPPIFNAVIGIASCLFVLAVTISYNYLNDEKHASKLPNTF